MTSHVADFYRGQVIFITGASGLMGKVLVEKLLYSCPGVKKIYVLIRPKKGKSVQVRMDEMFKLPMFTRVRNECPDQFKKVVALQGDVLSDNLGMQGATLQHLYEVVTIVFHFAATLRLEAKLKDAIDMNTVGTKRLLDICKKIKDLKACVHLSTAFCYADYERLQEKVHDPPSNPHDLMHAIEWMDEKALELATPAILQAHPNTYTYSKRLAEALVREYYPEIRLAVARPSIVCPAWEEPVPGWVDNLNGPVGLMIGAGKGVIRSMHCNGEYHAEVIPVDYAIAGLITIGYRLGSMDKMPQELPVYNITTGAAKNTTWADVLEMGRDTIRQYPFESPLWYPDGNIRKSKLVHNLCVLFMHLLPAYFIDFLMLIFGQKTFMVRVQKRISDGLEVLQFFTTREWKFENNNFTDLYDKLTPHDKKMFQMDFGLIDDKEFIKKCMLGGRQYCLKEPLSSLPKARLQNNILFVMDILVKFLFYGSMIWWVASYSETAKYVIGSVPIVGPKLF